jgi:predicted metalloendopeptidase
MKNILKLTVLALPMAMGVSTVSAQTSAGQSSSGINLSYLDTNTRPNDDFFRFVNGAWLSKTEIPADRTTWGSFQELLQNTDRDALTILKEAAKNPAYRNTEQGKAVNLYLSVMDTIARNKAGVTPLRPYLAKINAVKTTKDVQNLMIEMEPLGGIGFFGAGVGSDAKNSNKNVVSVGPGPVGLPDQDYYLSADADSKEKREKYVLHIARMLQFIGDTPAQAKANAEKILALETAMSKPRLTRVERRDRRKSYNPMTVADLQKMTPAIGWSQFLQHYKLKPTDTLIVSQPKYMEALQSIFDAKDLDSWKAYMRWTLLNRAASQLSTDIDAANFDFYGKTLTGAIKQRPREERALQTVNGSVGEALGQLYVAQKFPPEAKAKAAAMIENIIQAYEIRINNLSWMSADTKKKALEKLHKTRVKIGYPDKWKDYSKLVIESPANGGTLFANMQNVSRWRHEEDIEDLAKPVDKDEWGMTPQTVNAYYSPSFNEIVFPAAILQPPFYNYKADDAVNYGGIGAVIGHEISHGFDDSGARYNAEGNLVNWWTEADLTQFTQLGDALANQYSALEPLPGTKVDGKFTLGENIGDLGGINAAYEGLQLHMKKNGRPGLIDGYTPEQRFFISWATIWRTKSRDEAIRNQVKTDPHTPGMYRAYVPLQNVDAFYEAFNIKEGDGMWIEPSKRIKIW